LQLDLPQLQGASRRTVDYVDEMPPNRRAKRGYVAADIRGLGGEVPAIADLIDSSIIRAHQRQHEIAAEKETAMRRPRRGPTTVGSTSPPNAMRQRGADNAAVALQLSSISDLPTYRSG